MMRLLALSVVLTASIAAAQQAPQPATLPTSWDLDVRFENPQMIRVNVPGQGMQTFWYVLYTVTNRTGADRIFVPTFTLYTDTGQIIRSGRGVPGRVFQEIRQRHNNPLLMSPTDIAGRLLQGEDNARDGVAIFRDIEPQARAFDLFVGGLSGERAEVKLPVAVTVESPTLEGEFEMIEADALTLYKTLNLRFALPGDPASRFTVAPRLVERTWVMR